MFKEQTHWFSAVIESFYILISRAQEIQFLHILIYLFSGFFLPYNHPNEHYTLLYNLNNYTDIKMPHHIP